MSGRAEASTTRNLSIPSHFQVGCQYRAGVMRPIAQVPSGWLTVIAVARIQASICALVMNIGTRCHEVRRGTGREELDQREVTRQMVSLA